LISWASNCGSFAGCCDGAAGEGVGLVLFCWESWSIILFMSSVLIVVVSFGFWLLIFVINVCVGSSPSVVVMFA